MNLEKQNRNLWIVLGGISLPVVAILDYITGKELSFSLFYLIPITIFTWKLNINSGVVVAILSSLIWLDIEIRSGIIYSNPFVYFWNVIIRLGFFLTPVFLIGSLEQKRRETHIDYLTGAYNNRYFNQMLETEIHRSTRYEHPFTVAFIDTDNFKNVNDTFGHIIGDTLLRSLADLMKTHLRKTDVVARVGGDEFALLLPETDEKAARSAITHMTNSLLADMQKSGYPVTFSIGVLTLTAPDITADQIIGLADKMMYSVKNNGKNNVKYDTYKKDGHEG